ncbi:hypothetical protein [Kutzneria sp. NPDC052558]|uniref:hypothetical protein n=1 Tax=Kutzneria sp. NPDC052558 TaxID=3364121 RepID=UPI0037C75905
MTSIPPADTVARFLVRARQIEQGVRPLTADGEPTFYPKVLSAVWRLLDESPTSTARQHDQLTELNAAWNADDAEPAALALRTLRFLDQLRESGALTIDVPPATVYVPPPAPELPSLLEPLSDLEPLPELDPAQHKRFRVELKAIDGSPVADYDAPVVGQTVEGRNTDLRLLITDGVILRIMMAPLPEGEFDVRVRVVPARLDLRSAHAAKVFELAVVRAGAMLLGAPGGKSVELPLAGATGDNLVWQQRLTELLADLIDLEELTGREIGLPTRPITLFDRVRIRQLRQLWRGEVVAWDRVLGQLLGNGVPRWAAVPPSVLDVGGVRIPTPALRLGHPDAVWHDNGPVPELGPDTRHFTATRPDGVSRFLAWSPQTRPGDDLPDTAEPWRLPGVGEADCPF